MDPVGVSAEFLTRWNVRFDDLVAFAAPHPSETLLLTGSIPQGLGSPLSDIDLLLVTDSRVNRGLVLREPDFENMVGDVNGHEVHIECWRLADLERLSARLKDSLARMRPGGPLECADQPSRSQLKLLHRIRTGAPLANRENVALWWERLSLDDLPEYMTCHGLAEFAALREDAHAQAVHGDIESAVFMLRLAISSLAGALLASIGETNTYGKWRSPLLERHRQTLGDGLVTNMLRYLFADRSFNRTTLSSGLVFADRVASDVLTRWPRLAVWWAANGAPAS